MSLSTPPGRPHVPAGTRPAREPHRLGAPVAITGVMLMALGFSAVRAAVVVLLANTAPVAFGAIGTPIITAGTLTQIPYQEIGAYVGRQTPIVALVVPLLLVLLVDGWRG